MPTFVLQDVKGHWVFRASRVTAETMHGNNEASFSESDKLAILEVRRQYQFCRGV